MNNKQEKHQKKSQAHEKEILRTLEGKVQLLTPMKASPLALAFSLSSRSHGLAKKNKILVFILALSGMNSTIAGNTMNTKYFWLLK